MNEHHRFAAAGRVCATSLTLLTAIAATSCVALSGRSLETSDASAPQRNRAAIAFGDEHITAFDQPQEAMAFYVAQRQPLDGGDLPLENLLQATEHIRNTSSMRRGDGNEGGGSMAGDLLPWTELGPGNIGGRTRVLVIDPTNSDTMYAAGVSGGIWKTTDAGASWQPLDDFMLNLAVCAMVIDPTNPDILYAGTGEGFGSAGSYKRGLGIFKSIDAGATWQQLAGTVSGVPTGSFHYVNDLAISPNNADHIYAATRYGVWKSEDAGVTWTLQLANPRYLSGPQDTVGCQVGCTDLAIRSDTSPDVLFASFGSFEADGLYRTDNGGSSWVQYSVPASQGRMTVEFFAGDNDIAYLSMAGNSTVAVGSIQNVFRTDDGGASWNGQINFGPVIHDWLLGNLLIGNGCFEYMTYHQGWHDSALAVDPVNPDIVWIGGIDLFRSDDGGANWGIASYYYGDRFEHLESTHVHADQHRVVFHPDFNGTSNQIAYVVNDGGVFRTQNARAATGLEPCPLEPGPVLPAIVWENMNNGYAVTQFYHGDSARTADRFAGGAQDNGTNMVTSVGSNNEWDGIFGGDGGYVAFDPTDPLTMFVEIQFFPEIRKSIDGGTSFFDAVNGITDTDGLFITPFEMDQNNPQVLWTGGRRPWRTMDGAALWETGGPDFAGPDRISAIGISPSDGNIVYLGFNNGYVVRSTNALDPVPTWSIFTSGLHGAWVSSIAVDPGDPDVAYLTYSNYNVPHILKTIDGGAIWFSIDGVGIAGIPDIPAHWVAVRPCDSMQVYVGTEVGVFASDDGGATWTGANLGLANVVVETLDFKNNNQLVAFTHGRGAFLASLKPCASCPVDFNGDGVVNVVDLLAVLAGWGPCEDPCLLDIDGSESVGVVELLAVLAEWGTCAP